MGRSSHECSGVSREVTNASKDVVEFFAFSIEPFTPIDARRFNGVAMEASRFNGVAMEAPMEAATEASEICTL